MSALLSECDRFVLAKGEQCGAAAYSLNLLPGKGLEPQD